MGLTVNLTGTGRCGNAVLSPCQAIPPAAWPVDKGGFVVCRLQWSCFVIVSVNSDQLSSGCNLGGRIFISIVGIRSLDLKCRRLTEQKCHLRPPSLGVCLEVELEFLLLLVVLLEISNGQRWVAGLAAGCRSAGALQRNFQDAGGTLGFYLLTRGPECEIARDSDLLHWWDPTPHCMEPQDPRPRCVEPQALPPSHTALMGCLVVTPLGYHDHRPFII